MANEFVVKNGAITPNVQLTGSSSGSTTVVASAAASGTLTLPAATDTLATLAGAETLTNKTLTSPTLTTPNIGVATGTSLSVSGSLTSTVATGTAPLVVTSTTKVTNLNVELVDGYHASEANTASNIVVRDSAKKIYHSGAVLSGSTSGTTTVVASAAAGTTTITLPAVTGTVVTTGDTGSVTSTMILDGTIVNADINASAAIAVSKLAASTISGVTLGSNLNSLTAGTGLSGTAYNGSAAQTWTLATSGVSAASYGSASAVPVITVDTYGRITSATTAGITKNLIVGTRSTAVTIAVTSGSLTVYGRSANTSVALSL